MHHFQNLGKRKLKNELREKTPNMVAVLLDSHKPWIACQDVLFPKGFGMKNKSKPFICSVYYHSKCSIEGWKLKSTISERNLRA
jgi:hypothetical protein